MERIENQTFGELKPGDTARLVRTLDYKDIEVFAIMSGDVNPTHVDESFAKSDTFHNVVAHGMWGGALIFTVLGTELPGRKYTDRAVTDRLQDPRPATTVCAVVFQIHFK